MDLDRAEIYLLAEDERRAAPGGPALIGPDGVRREVPRRVYEAFRHVEEGLRAGYGVRVTAFRPELPIAEAAAAISMAEDDFRAYVEEGGIPVRKTQHADWVKLADVLAFTHHLESQREAAMQEMAEEERWDE